MIQGYIETVMIKSESLPPDEIKKYISIIHSGTQRLLKLVEELFELSKLEAKQVEPNLELFSIAELAQDVHQKNLVIAESQKIILSLNMKDKLPMIQADISMMERVFQNLLDNAYKFTPENGSITIDLSSSENCVIAGMKDTGIGIEKEDLTNIFDRYHKNKRVSVAAIMKVSDSVWQL